MKARTRMTARLTTLACIVLLSSLSRPSHALLSSHWLRGYSTPCQWDRDVSFLGIKGRVKKITEDVYYRDEAEIHSRYIRELLPDGRPSRVTHYERDLKVPSKTYSWSWDGPRLLSFVIEQLGSSPFSSTRKRFVYNRKQELVKVEDEEKEARTREDLRAAEYKILGKAVIRTAALTDGGTRCLMVQTEYKHASGGDVLVRDYDQDGYIRRQLRIPYGDKIGYEEMAYNVLNQAISVGALENPERYGKDVLRTTETQLTGQFLGHTLFADKFRYEVYDADQHRVEQGSDEGASRVPADRYTYELDAHRNWTTAVDRSYEFLGAEHDPAHGWSKIFTHRRKIEYYK